MTGHRFAGKRVLVTGGTSGIGRATALAFAREGARVMISGRDAGRGAEVAVAAEGLAGDISFLAADVTDPVDVSGLAQATAERLDGLDIAFNNAGFQERRALLHEQLPETYDLVFDTNLRSVFLAMQAQIKLMLATAAASSSTTARSAGGAIPTRAWRSTVPPKRRCCR
jgi:NAD(P)-dependent dehydrogenase (short-subunit alcohol dehydrogenase family)